MTRSMLIRVVEAFFRNRILYVLPLCIMVVLGVAVASNSNREYTSSGVLFVDRGSFVATQTGIANGAGGSYQTPAQYTSQELNALVQTDVFMFSILETAGVDTRSDPLSQPIRLLEARSAIGASPTSENLLQVHVTTDDPLLSQRLAEATIAEFVTFKIDMDVAESAASEAFFDNLVRRYSQELDAARASLDAFLETLPFGIVTEGDGITGLTPEQQTEYLRLTQDEADKGVAYREALANLEESRLAETQAETDVSQSHTVVDPPQVALGAESGLTDMVVTIMVFTIVGIVFMLVGPIVAAGLHRNVLLADELDHIPGPGVIAIVPGAAASDLKLRKVEAPEPSTASTARANAIKVAPPADASPTNGPSDAAEPGEAAEPSEATTAVQEDPEPRSRWARA